MTYLVVIRHGQSIWNVVWKFAGSNNVPLNETGKQQARDAAKKIGDIRYDYAFVSQQQHAIDTLSIICGTMFDIAPSFMFPNTIYTAALNERDYGDIEGMSKDEAEARYGKEIVHAWRKKYDGRPPNGQSLAEVHALVKPLFENEILPKLRNDKNVLVVGHGNTLRTLILEVEQLPVESVEEIWIENADPWVYRYENGTFKFKCSLDQNHA